MFKYVIFAFSFSVYAQVPILQGPTTENLSEIIVLRKSNESYRYEVSPESTIEVFSFAPSPSNWVIDTLKVTNQKIAHHYSNRLEPQKLTVWSGIKKIDERDFNFLLPQNNLRIALVSCASDKFTLVGNKKPWESVQKTNPQVMLWLGDNVYAAYFEPINPTQFWNRFVETRKALNVFYWKKLVPSFAVWDDHDYGGGNNGDETYPHRQEVAKIFKAFFGQLELGDEHFRGPGVAQSFVIGAHRFVMMDGRSFRSQKSTPLDQRTLWGVEQFEWLKDIVLKAEQENQYLWLANGTKFFKTEPDGESYENDQPQAMQATADLLAPLLNNNLVTLLSGDAHYSEIISSTLADMPVVEITSSSIHSVRSPGSKIPETPLRQVGFYGDSFVVLDIHTYELQGFKATAHASSNVREVFVFNF